MQRDATPHPQAPALAAPAVPASSQSCHCHGALCCGIRGSLSGPADHPGHILPEGRHMFGSRVGGKPGRPCSRWAGGQAQRPCPASLPRRPPACHTPPPRHSQCLQTVQALEAVGPQALDAVVMEVPVWGEGTCQAGRPQPRPGQGAGGGWSGTVEAEAPTDGPSARALGLQRHSDWPDCGSHTLRGWADRGLRRSEFRWRGKEFPGRS